MDGLDCRNGRGIHGNGHPRIQRRSRVVMILAGSSHRRFHHASELIPRVSFQGFGIMALATIRSFRRGGPPTRAEGFRDRSPKGFGFRQVDMAVVAAIRRTYGALSPTTIAYNHRSHPHRRRRSGSPRHGSKARCLDRALLVRSSGDLILSRAASLLSRRLRSTGKWAPKAHARYKLLNVRYLC